LDNTLLNDFIDEIREEIKNFLESKKIKHNIPTFGMQQGECSKGNLQLCVPALKSQRDLKNYYCTTKS
jgi:hypothetical protein